MVGYVLLVVFSVIIGTVVYQWLSTYVPTEPLGCPEGSSLFVKDAIFDSSDSTLNLTLKNNGRFNIAGYFIHAKNSSSQELAIIDLSIYLNESSGGNKFGNSVLFTFSGENSLKPGNQKTNIFDIPPEIGEPYSIRIIPTRFQEEDNRERFVSCGNARVEQIVGAPPVVCVPDTCSDLSYVCGSWSDGCGGIIDCNQPGCDSNTEFCDASGQCISTSCIPAADPTLIGICGTQDCDVSTATNGTCGTVDCGTCPVKFECDAGQCVALCGDGIIDSGEECDDGNTVDGDGCSSTCTIETSWECSGEPSVCTSIASCPEYCVLSLGYSTGFCTNSPGNCQSSGGVYEAGGDQWCTGGSQADTCCCQP